jgi:phosphoribosylaminoimidazole-succinocarboxamide synthase
MNIDTWNRVYSGKVRDLYVEGDSLESADRVLMVASDRVSAFDFVLSPGIPGKGELLTTLSLWWFDQLDVPNHLLAPGDLELPGELAGRSMLVRTLDMYPIECVVRGYLSGSGWLEYQASHTVCGLPLPAGLHDGDRLPEPIFTPAYKAPLGEHDENITFQRVVELVGEEAAVALRDASLAIFATASAIAEKRGVILADTKFEFGANRKTGELTLADEVLTSDSSRYWDAAVYAADGPDRLASFDKQIVRNWLSANWDRSAGSRQADSPPELPQDIVDRTAARYAELLERLTGE